MSLAHVRALLRCFAPQTGRGAYLFSPTTYSRALERAAGLTPLVPLPPPSTALDTPTNASPRLSLPFKVILPGTASPPFSRATPCRQPSEATPLPRLHWRASFESRRCARPPHPPPDRFISGAIFPRHFHHHTLPFRAKFLCPTGVARGYPTLAVSPPPPPTLFFPSRRGRLPPPAKLRAVPAADLTSFPPRLLMDPSPWTGTFREKARGMKTKMKIDGGNDPLLLLA